MNRDVKVIKGECHFVYTDKKVRFYYKDFDDWMIGIVRTEYPIYDLIDGKSFAEMVECGGFIDYDGSLSNIFVNDYVSNLGIWSDNFHKGNGFFVSLEEFKKICHKYKVEVNWANK